MRKEWKNGFMSADKHSLTNVIPDGRWHNLFNGFELDFNHTKQVISNPTNYKIQGQSSVSIFVFDPFAESSVDVNGADSNEHSFREKNRSHNPHSKDCKGNPGPAVGPIGKPFSTGNRTEN